MSLTFIYTIDNIFKIIGDICFRSLNIIVILFAILIIISKNPMHSIFSLIICFGLVSFLLLGYLEILFLPIIFLIVYVGAISILFLFIVMLLNIKKIDLTDKFINYLPVSIVIGILFTVELLIDISWGLNFEKINLEMYLIYDFFVNKIDNISDIEIIALLVYEEYAIVFMLAAILLLIAMVGTILLTLRINLKVKKQNISEQVFRKIDLKIKYLK